MAEAYNRRSALQHFGLKAAVTRNAADARVFVGESAHRAIVNVRGNPKDSAFVQPVKAVTGADLPVKANTTSEAGSFRLLWLGPTEYWVTAPAGSEEKLVADLRQALTGQHAAVIDVSESRAIITLSGPDAREVLARGCSLDLHPRVFGPGQCAQTGLTKANVLIDQRDATPSYDIYVLKSFSDYLWQWLGLVNRDFKAAIKAE